LLKTVWATTDGSEPTITWDLPQGWKREEGGAEGFAARFATLKAPGGDAEIAVSLARGTIIGNVQRWWGQLWGDERAGDITPVTMQAYVQQRETSKDRLYFRVDLAGPNDPSAKRPMMNPHGGG
jgi:hypothetical protein